MAISDLDYADDSDLALIRRTRMGDTDAYGLLHERHAGSARALAWRMSRSAADADDLVSEGFARVLSALQRGSGPDTAFRPYLLSTIRRLAYDRTTREQREAPVAYDLDEERPSDDPVLAGFERSTAAAAFASLPERWRMVLWHTEVEGETPAQVAQLLGMKPNAVAALAYRAREGLRQAYLTHHAGSGQELSRECGHTTDRLAAYVRGGLAPGQQERVASHLEQCERCQAAYLELASVNTSLRSVLAPLVLGSAAAAYLAELASPTAVTAVGVGGAGGAALGGRALAHGLRRAVGSPARGAVAAGVAAVVAVTVGVLATRGAPAQQVAATSPPAAVGAAPAPGPTTAPEDTFVLPASTPDRVPPDTVPAAPPAARRGRSAADGAQPGRSVPGPGLPQAPVVPSTSVPPTTSAPTTVPPTTVPATTVPPTTAPATTVPATTTTTTTAPPPPSKLQVGLSSAGNVVAGRPGVLVVAVSNPGEGEAHQVRLRLDLQGITVRGVPRQSASAGTPASPAWACSADAASLTCTTDAVAVGAVSSLYVPVLAPADAHQAGAAASATGSSDASDPGATRSVELPVRPEGMAARFAAVERGDVRASGNSLVTCPEASAGCLDARLGQGARLDNGDHAMVAVDTDDDPATADSSSAVVTCPAGPDVLSASLYWGARLTPGPGGQPPEDPAAVGRAVVVAPDGTRTEVWAERVDQLGSRYQAVADVTALVAAGGAGSWTVGGVQLATGENAYGGWSLVVACADDAAPLRSLVVLDGLTEIRAGSGVSLEVGGFSVPAAGGGAAVATTVTYEGDLGLTGDQLAVAGRAVADALNPLGNTFNSTASALGLPAAGSVPGDPNLFGFDVDRFDVTGSLPPGATSTVLDLSTADDVYLPGVVAFAVDQ